MMTKFTDLLNSRFRQKETPQLPKMTALVEKSNSGQLSSFSGVFRIAALNTQEKETLETLLKTYSDETTYDASDLTALMAITSEVKAITNQAILLHGERIKRAQELLTKYRDGAFTAWLFAIYGNRQTPYNFLQYYEFYHAIPTTLHTKIDEMPRQAIYTLASRGGTLAEKVKIVETYAGQTKAELLTHIRKIFPLADDDKRTPNFASHAMTYLKRVKEILKNPLCRPEEDEKQQMQHLLAQLQEILQKR